MIKIAKNVILFKNQKTADIFLEDTKIKKLLIVLVAWTLRKLRWDRLTKSPTIICAAFTQQIVVIVTI